jgi:hypothetical protein
MNELENHTISDCSSEYVRIRGCWFLALSVSQYAHVARYLGICSVRWGINLGTVEAKYSRGGDTLLGNFTFCPMPRPIMPHAPCP